VKKLIALALAVPCAAAALAVAVSCSTKEPGASSAEPARFPYSGEVPVFVMPDDTGQLIVIPETVYVHADIPNHSGQEVHWIALDGNKFTGVNNLSITLKPSCNGLLTQPPCPPNSRHCKMAKPLAAQGQCDYKVCLDFAQQQNVCRDPRIIVGN
jgi:hypothetical protein